MASKLDSFMEELLGNQTLQSSAPSPCVERPPSDGWRRINWVEEATKLEGVDLEPSPVDLVLVRDRLVHFKRDDTLRLEGSQVSGNKARKMLALNYLDDFPSCIVSYGGPQSNAMVALAAIARFKNDEVGQPNRTKLVYYTKTLPTFLRNQPSGNLFRAQMLGMELRQLPQKQYNELFGSEWGGLTDPPPDLAPPVEGDSVWVPQGGASDCAIAGARKLAKEIVDYWSLRGDGKPLTVFVPGGTCSTAQLLHVSLRELCDNPLDIDVVVVPCVGDQAYARRQMMALNAQLDHPVDDIATALPPVPKTPRGGVPRSDKDSYFSFGKPNAALLSTFRQMKDDYEIPLDLLYGASAWTTLLRHWRSVDGVFMGERELMYVHSGGLEGINTQLLRYKYEGLVDDADVQLPGRS